MAGSTRRQLGGLIAGVVLCVLECERLADRCWQWMHGGLLFGLHAASLSLRSHECPSFARHFVGHTLLCPGVTSMVVSWLWHAWQQASGMILASAGPNTLAGRPGPPCLASLSLHCVTHHPESACVSLCLHSGTLISLKGFFDCNKKD